MDTNNYKKKWEIRWRVILIIVLIFLIILIIIYGVLRIIHIQKYIEADPIITAIIIPIILSVIFSMLSIPRIYNYISDKWYRSLDELDSKAESTINNYKVLWVDDEINSKTFLPIFKGWGKKTFENFKMSSTVPDASVLNDYHIFIFDIRGVEQRDNDHDALNILIDQLDKNPFRIFMILTGEKNISKAVIKRMGFHYYTKRDGEIQNAIEMDIKNYLAPTWLWENKINWELQHPMRRISPNTIAKIKTLFIKDWDTIINIKRATPTRTEDLRLWKFAKKQNNIELRNLLTNLCEFIIL